VKNKIILFILLSITQLFSYTLYETEKEIKKLKKEIKKNEKFIENKITEIKKQNPIFAPKDMFESEDEYLLRQTDATEMLNRMRKKYIDDLWLKMNLLRSKVYETNNIGVDFVSYDPNTEILTFLVRHNGFEKEQKQFKSKVARDDAKKLYENWNNMEKTGILVIEPDEKVRLIKIFIREKKSNWSYSWQFYKMLSLKYDNRIHRIDISNNGEYLAYGGENNEVIIYNVWEGKNFATFKTTGGIVDVYFSADSKQVFIVDRAGRIYIYRLKYQRLMNDMNLNSPIVSSSVSNDFNFAAIAFEDKPAVIINLKTGLIVKEFKSQPKATLIEFSVDGKLIVLSQRNNFIRIFETATSKLVREFRMRGEIFDLSLSQDKKLLAIAGSVYTALFNVKTGKVVYQIKANKCNTVYIGPFNHYLYIGTEEGKVLVFVIESKKIEREFIMEHGIKDLSVTPDGNYVIAADQMGVLNFYRTLFKEKSNFIIDKAVKEPPILEVEIAFNDENHDKILEADEKATIDVTIVNRGKGAAKGLDIAFEPKKVKNLNYNDYFIEEIASGDSVVASIPIEAYVGIKSGKQNFIINFNELNGFRPDPIDIQFYTKEYLKPFFIVEDYGIEDQNNNGKIEAGEIVKLNIRIKNNSPGRGKDVYAKFETGKNVFITETYPTIQRIGDLESDKSVLVGIEFFINNNINKSIPIYLNISESTNTANVEKLWIPLYRSKVTKTIRKEIFTSAEDIFAQLEKETISIDIERNIPQNPVNKNRIGVVFGIEKYRNVGNVSFAQRDAVFASDYFQKSLGIDKDNIYLRLNDQATKGEFDKVFSKNGWLDKRIKEGKTEIFFYYAGHGAPDTFEKKSYLVPFDGDPNYPSQTCFAMDKILSSLDELKSKHNFVFLDACFSGVDRESNLLLENSRPIVINQMIDN